MGVNVKKVHLAYVGGVVVSKDTVKEKLKQTKWELLYIASLVVIFGIVSLAFGYDQFVTASVFAALGTIAGYVVGKKTS